MALELSEKTARQLVWAARELEALPRLQRALSEGGVTWDQLLPLIRLCRTGDTEERWLALAAHYSVAQLEALARRRREKDAKENEKPLRNSMRLRPDPEKGVVDYHGRAWAMTALDCCG